jgi:hypothetical protein
LSGISWQMLAGGTLLKPYPQLRTPVLPELSRAQPKELAPPHRQAHHPFTLSLPVVKAVAPSSRPLSNLTRCSSSAQIVRLAESP